MSLRYDLHIHVWPSNLSSFYSMADPKPKQNSTLDLKEWPTLASTASASRLNAKATAFPRPSTNLPASTNATSTTNTTTSTSTSITTKKEVKEREVKEHSSQTSATPITKPKERKVFLSVYAPHMTYTFQSVL
jgi:hypothetical protein